jgi:hypothetical protein
MKIIVWPPKWLESFTRCECDYHLLDLQDGRYAIEWAEHICAGGETYAIVYEMLDDAKDDFGKLRDRGLSYRAIEERTTPENILGNPPWVEREWDTIAKVIEKDDFFWNGIVIDRWKEEIVFIGPYNSFEEATASFTSDFYNITEKVEKKKLP